MDIWQMKNGDVPDLAVSLYHMAHYNSINNKFQILDTFIKFLRYAVAILKSWLIRD